MLAAQNAVGAVKCAVELRLGKPAGAARRVAEEPGDIIELSRLSMLRHVAQIPVHDLAVGHLLLQLTEALRDGLQAETTMPELIDEGRPVKSRRIVSDVCSVDEVPRTIGEEEFQYPGESFDVIGVLARSAESRKGAVVAFVHAAGAVSSDRCACRVALLNPCFPLRLAARVRVSMHAED